jgi:hypothetical protein
LSLFAALSLLPLAAGFHLFNLASLAAAAFLLWRSNVPPWCIALGLISPAVIWNLYLGQLGLLCGALLIFGLSRIENQPWLGGLALSLLALKPPYALLVPIAVLARRNWTAVAAGALGLTMQIGLSCLFIHASPWSSYLSDGREAMHRLLVAPFIYGRGHDSYEY